MYNIHTYNRPMYLAHIDITSRIIYEVKHMYTNIYIYVVYILYKSTSFLTQFPTLSP